VVGSDIELTWPSLGGGIEYYVYWSNTRSGFYVGSFTILNSGATVPGSPYTHTGAAAAVGENYYMIIPYNTALGTNGSSTYTIGVWIVEYNGNEMLGLPLKPDWGDKSADWYVDQIPFCLGITYLENGVWKSHFKEFPAGVFDITIRPGIGFEVSVYETARFSFQGW
jgi:hypothetical protein